MSIFAKTIIVILITTFGATPGQAPVVQAPPVQASVVQAPPVQASVVQEPVVQATVVQEPVQATGVVAIDATDAQRDVLDDVLHIYAEANLELPALEVYFHDTTDGCRGNSGLHLGAPENTPSVPGTVHVCDGSRMTLIHELGHGWAHTTLDTNAEDMMLDYWGLQSWRDGDDDWKDRGTERAAQTVAFGLTLKNPSSSDHILQYVCGYELMTGQSLPNPDLFDC